MPYRLLTQIGLKQHKGEHQVRYDGGITPDQTITDGAEPNSKLTAKMSVPGQERRFAVIVQCPLLTRKRPARRAAPSDAMGLMHCEKITNPSPICIAEHPIETCYLFTH